MTDMLAYIEDYFTNTLDESGRKVFEKKCETDQAFAQEVAVYALTRQGLREELLQQKQKQWKALGVVKEGSIAAPVRKITFMKWVPYAAAACILMAVVFTFLNGNTSPQQLADNYIKQNIVNISGQMDAAQDSMAKAVGFYKIKRYDSALNILTALNNDLPVVPSQKKLEGFVYLVTDNYDKALAQFEELAKMELESNPGMFLKAVTLMRRNNAGDKEQAKLLLQKVIDEKQEGGEEAAKMLKELN